MPTALIDEHDELTEVARWSAALGEEREPLSPVELLGYRGGLRQCRVVGDIDTTTAAGSVAGA
jgi:hypothetical protein